MTHDETHLVHDPGGTGFVIHELWAYVAVHADSDEGVIGASINGMVMPLVAADRTRLDELRPYAERAAAFAGKPVKLVRFTAREDVETIEPASTFTCPSCHRTTFNPTDVETSFCGNCRRFWRQLNPGVWDDGMGALHIDIDENLRGNGYEVNEQTRRMLTETWRKLIEQGQSIEIIE